METLAIYYALFVCNDKSKIINFADEPLKSCLNTYHIDKIKIITTLQKDDLLTLALDDYKLVDTLWKAVVKHKWLNGLDIIVKTRFYNNKEMLLFCLEEKWKDGILRLLKECDDNDFYSLVNAKNLESHCFTPKVVGYKPSKCSGAKLDEPVKKNYIIRPHGRHLAVPLGDHIQPVREPFKGCPPDKCHSSLKIPSEQFSKEELNKFRKQAKDMFEKCINNTKEEKEIFIESLKKDKTCASCLIEGRDAEHVECPYKKIKICYPHFESKDYDVDEFTEFAICSPKNCSKCQESENGEFDMVSDDEVKDI